MGFNRTPYPFKRPFKGKRVARRDLDDLMLEAGNVVRQLERLSDEWRIRANVEGMTLSLVRQGAPALRWRLNPKHHGKQRYVDLFGESGDSVLSPLSADAIRFLIGYETHRLLLNARSRAVHASHDAFRHYIEATDRLQVLLKDLESR